MQLTLWELENPLKPQMAKDFFKSVPTCPGVYRLLDVNKEVLYVGKAKNLRIRVRYYKSKALMSSSRKLRELVRRVCSVDFEVCESESAALLRENELLAKLKPPYNMLNTRPEAYPYIGFRVSESRIELKHAFELNEFDEGFEIFGAFRGTGGSLRAFNALLRQMHFWFYPETQWPLLFVRPKSVRQFVFKNSDQNLLESTAEVLRHYFNGNFNFPKASKLPPVMSGLFYETWWKLDLERISWLQSACENLKAIREMFQVEGTVIEKTKLNDLSTLISLKRQETSRLQKLHNSVMNGLVETEKPAHLTG